MQRELFIAILAGFGAMFGWGFADLFAKKTIDEIGDIVSLVWAHVFGTIAFFLILFYQVIVIGNHSSLPQRLADWLLLVFFGVAQGIVYILVYKGFGKGQVALLNPVFASFSGIVALISVAFLGEKLTGHLPISLGIIFIGILLISMDVEALSSKKVKLGNVAGLKEIGLATIFAAAWTLSWVKFVRGKDWLIYALFMYAFMSLFLIIYAAFQQVKLKVKKAEVWKFLFLIGFCETLAYASMSLGYSRSSFTSVVALISGAFSLPTIIFARIFLKEKVGRIQTVGTLTIIAGIITLSLV